MSSRQTAAGRVVASPAVTRSTAARTAAARRAASDEYCETYEPVTEATRSSAGYNFSNERPRAPLSPEEAAVQRRGYPHVNTIVLAP